MKKIIDRIAFGFRDDEILPKLEERFIPWCELLNRLILETYHGKRMFYIVIYFRTQKDYADGAIKKNSVHYYHGNLTYHGFFDLETFNQMNSEDQVRYVWDLACDYLIRASEDSNNTPLAEACCYAHTKGLDLGLNPDFRTLSVPVELYGQRLLANVWMRYQDPEMLISAVFTLEQDEHIIYEQQICTVDVKYEFFPGWFKKIEVKNGDTVIVKGHYELDCLPLKIPISEDLILGK